MPNAAIVPGFKRSKRETLHWRVRNGDVEYPLEI